MANIFLFSTMVSLEFILCSALAENSYFKKKKKKN